MIDSIAQDCKLIDRINTVVGFINQIIFLLIEVVAEEDAGITRFGITSITQIGSDVDVNIVIQESGFEIDDVQISKLFPVELNVVR